MKFESLKANSYKVLLVLPLAIILSLVAPSMAQANTAPHPAEESTGVEDDSVTLTNEEISNLEALTSATKNSDAGPVFDAALALKLGATQSSISGFSAGLNAGVGRLTKARVSEDTTQEQGVLAAARACSGASGFTGYYWFGPQIAMDSCQTDLLQAGIGIALAGGGVYTAASALTAAGLPAAAVIGVVTAVIGLGLGFVSLCKAASSHGGIYLNGGIPGIIAPSCWGQ
ncbi:MAG: hypothetical protein ACRCSP_08465 [Rhodoglobus sp.]